MDSGGILLKSRKEKQEGEVISPVIIGSKALLREATFVGRSCGIDQLVDEVTSVFVKGDEIVEHELVEISLRIALASEPSCVELYLKTYISLGIVV